MAAIHDIVWKKMILQSKYILNESDSLTYTHKMNVIP